MPTRQSSKRKEGGGGIIKLSSLIHEIVINSYPMLLCGIPIISWFVCVYVLLCTSGLNMLHNRAKIRRYPSNNIPLFPQFCILFPPARFSSLLLKITMEKTICKVSQQKKLHLLLADCPGYMHLK